MCTIVVKAFKDIPAVPVMHTLCTHDQNGIDIVLCIQLITAASSMHNISESYASVMPNWLTKAFFNPEFERHRINIHQYCDSDNVQKMLKMDDLHLLDFVELRLKSKGDFNTAYDVAMHTGLAAYLKKFFFFSQGIGHANFIVDKSCTNHLTTLSTLIQDFQMLLCNRTIFSLIIPHILFQ